MTPDPPATGPGRSAPGGADPAGTTDPRAAAAVDAVVVGGGLFGCCIALFLRREIGLRSVLVVEREGALLARASSLNQARIHNGYHYPRSFTTAFRSRVNLPRFVADFPGSVTRDFTHVYAIARTGSKVTARQFETFCREIGAPLDPAPPAIAGRFSRRLIEAVYVVEEPVFDAGRVAAQLAGDLDREGVGVLLRAEVAEIRGRAEGDPLDVVIADRSSCTDPARRSVSSRWVFDCTYAGLASIPGAGEPIAPLLKYEIAEIALIEPPPPLRDLGVTVMDGPFFSTLPFPPRGLHSLSHVRYTPHFQWTAETAGRSPYDVLDAYRKRPRAGHMVRDAARYLPALADARVVDSFFEIKAILQSNEVDDGRPILFERHPEHRRLYSVLGGKIDNIYDILAVLGPSIRAGGVLQQRERP